MTREQRITGVAWYKPDQWNRLLDLSEDRDELESTHAEWKSNAERVIDELKGQGISIRKVTVDIDELLGWCSAGGLPVNAQTRTQFVAEKLRLQFEE